MQDRFTIVQADAIDFLHSLPSDSVDVSLSSPPFEGQRLYSEVQFKLRKQAWVDWMCQIVVGACRVSRGLVFINAAGPVEDRQYSATMEWLVTDLNRIHGIACGPAPYAWWKVCGIPGSGQADYQRRDWEPIYGFIDPSKLPVKWSDNTAYGHAPKYGPGGEFSTRKKNGDRANDSWDRPRTDRKKDGSLQTQVYAPPALANPGNFIIDGADSSVIEARVGGGHLGHPMAHDGEAPMSLAVAERFVRWFCPPDGVVMDFFCGTGTTAQAAKEHGRRFIGCDLRMSQVEICRERLSTVTPSLFAEATS